MKKIKKKLYKVLCNRIFFGILFSIVFSIFLMLLNYYSTNKQIAGSTEIELISNLRTFIYKWLPKSENQNEFKDVLFIDVSNDIELINVVDRYKETIGNIAVTDREKLAQFINLLEDDSKLIYIGVEFDSIYRSKNDDELSYEITKKKNVILPYILKQGEIQKPFINSITGLSAYWSSIKSNRFFKYEFIANDTIKSVALLMSEILNNMTIKKKGMFYYDDGRICINNIVINNRVKTSNLKNQKGIKEYKKIGYDILGMKNIKDSMSNFVNNRIIMIGDFESYDLHSTIYGNIPGTIINYNAYLTLKENKHIVPKSLMWFVFLFYAIFSFIIFISYDKVLYRKTLKVLLKYKIVKITNSFITKHHLRNVFVKLTENIIALTFLFSLSSLLIFIIYDIYFSILVSSGVFIFLTLIRDILTKKLKHKK